VSFSSPDALNLYVALDDRDSRPSWMAGFGDTGDNLTGSDNRTFSIYYKTVPAGKVELGASEGTNNAYTLFVTVAEPTSPQSAARGARGARHPRGIGLCGSVLTISSDRGTPCVVRAADARGRTILSRVLHGSGTVDLARVASTGILAVSVEVDGRREIVRSVVPGL
jgi:hypothetical protein